MKAGRAIARGVSALLVVAAGAATPPGGFFERVLLDGSAAGAELPTAVAYEPGAGHVWVTEKGPGDVETTARVRRKDALSGAVTTALSLGCVDSQGERGLLGIAFSPSWLAPGGAGRQVYLYYTRRFASSGACAVSGQPVGARNRVSRFTENAGVLSGEQLILQGPYLSSATNHNGGTVRFAPDGTLFVSMGDNDTDNAPVQASRDLSDLRGKLLRIQADGSIPADNPFLGQSGVRPEIWAWGLRNPFRFSVDPASGAPWIADVGENTWEEIDFGIAGADYGYPCLEGPAQFRVCNPVPAPGSLTAPVYVYGHASETPPVSGEAVIGGPVYRHSAFPVSYQGNYFFGDYVDGWIRRAQIGPGNALTNVQMFLPDATAVVDIEVSPAGCLTWVGLLGDGVREVCFQGADADGDGYPAGEDCDDHDPAAHPGAAEACDGNDDDCDGTIPASEQDPDGDGLVECTGWNDTQGDNPQIHGGGELADADHSGHVDGRDLARLGRAFADSCGGARFESSVDFDQDCTVDGEDLSFLALHFGESP